MRYSSCLLLLDKLNGEPANFFVTLIHSKISFERPLQMGKESDLSQMLSVYMEKVQNLLPGQNQYGCEEQELSKKVLVYLKMAK